MGKRHVTTGDILLFAEAWICLLRARWMLVFRPFSKIVPLMKDNNSNWAQADTRLLEHIQLSIMRASAKSPWRTKCFEQALAAKMMLKRRRINSTIYFGISKDGNKMNAHAWLKSHDFLVTGWQKLADYSIIAKFGS